MPTRPSAAIAGLRALAVLWAVAVAPLALLLLLVADSGGGRVFAITSLLTAVLPWAWARTWGNDPRAGRPAALVLSAIWLAGFGLTVWRAPSGTAPAAGRVQSVYAGGPARFSRFALGNLLPEGDQLLLGFTLMPLVDPLFTTAQAAELKRLTAALYRELEGSREFHRLASVMPLAHAELRGSLPASGHTFVYVPTGLDRTKPCPVLVFFHGSGGNFKAYLWLLAKVADQAGEVLVAPTYGLGNWRTAPSEVAYRDALAAIPGAVTVDRGRIHVMGLSNGGLAVSQLAAATGTDFRSLVFLSPVFDAAEIRGRGFAERCRGKPVLILTGGADDRVPLSYVEENAAAMEQSAAHVRLRSFPREDHFLLFSQRDQVIDALAAWLRENG